MRPLTEIPFKLKSRITWSSVLVLLLLAAVPPAFAADDQPFDMTQTRCESRTGARPEPTLRCDFEDNGSFDDTIAIIDRTDGTSLLPARTRVTLDDLNMQEALWLIDLAGDDVIDMVIDFYRADETVVAELYHAPLPEGAQTVRVSDSSKGVSFQFQRGQPVFDDLPPVRIVGKDGWWLRDGRISLNLDVFIDGARQVTGVFGALDYPGYFEKDGSPDIRIQVRDLDDDGRPDYDWRTVLVDEEADIYDQVQKTQLMVNHTDNEARLLPVLPWPYLGPLTYGYLTVSPSDTSQPPIQFDTDKGLITTVGEFVRSRGNDSQWFVYSYPELIPGERNVPNFEVPFSWYNFAGDDDRTAEAALRVLYSAPDDPSVVVDGTRPYPLTNIRYSWDQDNNGLWDYKLGLLDRHDVESTVTLPETDVDMQMLPYEDAIQWVFDRKWRLVVFVSAEEGVSGEGIYEWDAPAWMRDLYFTGRVDTPLPLMDDGTLNLRSMRFFEPGDDRFAISPDMRGEYQFANPQDILLYISPIDRKLHLRNAEEGVWNVGGEAEVRSYDRNENGFLDTWSYYPGPSHEVQPEQTVFFTGRYLIYSGQDRIIIKPFNMFESLVTLKPPVTGEQWSYVGELVEQYSRSFSPSDLSQMVTQYEIPGMTITGATLEDISVDKNGTFTFSLITTDNTRVTRDFGFAGLRLPDQAGAYRIKVTDGLLNVMPLRPSELIVPGEVRFSPAPVEALHRTEVAFTIRNLGNQPVHDVEVQLHAQQGAESKLINTTILDIDGESEEEVVMGWHPEGPGRWQLSLAVDTPEQPQATTRLVSTIGGSLQEGAHTVLANVLVDKAPQAAVADLLSLNGQHAYDGRVPVALLLLTGLFAAYISMLILRYYQNR